MRKTFPQIKWSAILLVSVAVAVVGTLATAFCGGKEFATASVVHPMDPLTAGEYSAVIRALIEENHVDEGSGLYPLITLEEPAKD